jgi:NADP-dependent 3-hydroxy acid dehydrogenase YdfG
MTQGIKDKIVVVTGASSGLGEATARLLSEQGGTLVLGARRADRLQALANEIEARGGKALALETDVTRREQVTALVDAAVHTYGRIDVMINNAGLMPQAPLEQLKVDEWDRMIDVNLKGVTYGIAASLPHMQRQKSGHFVNVSSVAGHKVGPGFAVYSATKFAVRALSEGLRQEVKPYNIRTTVISPGAVATELREHRQRSRGRRASARLLRRGRGARGLVREGRRVRAESASGSRHQRDPLPANQAGALRACR